MLEKHGKIAIANVRDSWSDDYLNGEWKNNKNDKDEVCLGDNHVFMLLLTRKIRYKYQLNRNSFKKKRN